ncbi:MAG: hypothetical protein NCW75_13980 [Phycisphaera sp.]|nr:MAG: hypothetical protein NCW75_13980 [Phycisphaera sp.]
MSEDHPRPVALLRLGRLEAAINERFTRPDPEHPHRLDFVLTIRSRDGSRFDGLTIDDLPVAEKLIAWAYDWLFDANS